jgi:hypothetical protein
LALIYWNIQLNGPPSKLGHHLQGQLSPIKDGAFEWIFLDLEIGFGSFASSDQVFKN